MRLRWSEACSAASAATISAARETSASPIRRWVTKRTRLVSRSSAEDAALGEQPDEIVGIELRAADVDEHDVRLDLGRLDLETRDLLEQRAELARPPVVVGEPVDERVERDERRGGRDARLVHARPAEPAQRLVRQLDHLRRGRRGSSPSARTGPCSG